MANARVLLKLSGEALMGNQGYGIDPEIVQAIARDVAEVVDNIERNEEYGKVGWTYIVRALFGGGAGGVEAGADGGTCCSVS